MAAKNSRESASKECVRFCLIRRINVDKVSLTGGFDSVEGTADDDVFMGGLRLLERAWR